MKNGFKYYPLIGGGLGGANKRPIDHAYDSKESAFKISTFCLETFAPGTYRLLAKHPTTINTYYYFDIRCPHCNCKLEPITQAKDERVLPMYACTVCDK